MSMKPCWNYTDRGSQSTRRKPCAISTWSTKNLT